MKEKEKKVRSMVKVMSFIACRLILLLLLAGRLEVESGEEGRAGDTKWVLAHLKYQQFQPVEVQFAEKLGRVRGILAEKMTVIAGKRPHLAGKEVRAGDPTWVLAHLRYHPFQPIQVQFAGEVEKLRRILAGKLAVLAGKCIKHAGEEARAGDPKRVVAHLKNQQSRPIVDLLGK